SLNLYISPLHTKPYIHSLHDALPISLHKKESVTQLLKHFSREAEILSEQQQVILQKLQEDIPLSRTEEPSFDHPEQIEMQLAARRDLWIQRQNEKSTFEQKINALTIQLHHQTTQIRK